MSVAKIGLYDADWNFIDGGDGPADHRRVFKAIVARHLDDDPCPFDCCYDEGEQP